MRTTLTLDEENALALQGFMERTDVSFKRAVNEALRAGLRSLGVSERRDKPFRVKSSPMGLRKEFRGKNLSRLADELEIEDMRL